MLHSIPIELLWSILSFLEYSDLQTLQYIKPLRTSTVHFIQGNFPFHRKVCTLLRNFENDNGHENQMTTANLALEFICEAVKSLPVFDRKAKFNELLAILQQLTVERVLASNLKPGMERNYAHLCLEIREKYLHTASIRGLHDPKYRRRSTKYPLAPFLPRVFTSIWKEHCSQKIEENRKIRTRFANYFGSLFEITSLYLESNLDGSFEECTREALVSGNVQDLLILCRSAGRRVEVEEMCRMVYMAGEQFRAYLDSMSHWMNTEPTPQQELRMQRDQELRAQNRCENTEEEMIPEWLIPDRYKVHKDTILRLKLMNNLFINGWRWFPVYY